MAAFSAGTELAIQGWATGSVMGSLQAWQGSLASMPAAFKPRRSASDAHQSRASRCRAYPHPAGQHGVDGSIAGVDHEAQRIEGSELLQAGDDQDPLAADPCQHTRAQGLVAAPEQEALAADDAGDDRRGVTVQNG